VYLAEYLLPLWARAKAAKEVAVNPPRAPKDVFFVKSRRDSLANLSSSKTGNGIPFSTSCCWIQDENASLDLVLKNLGVRSSMLGHRHIVPSERGH
jgi:hypothetical protein